MPQPVTLGVLGERMSQMQSMLAEIQRDVKSVQDQALDRRVTKLEDSQRWVIRTLAGAFISTAIAAISAIVMAS